MEPAATVVSGGSTSDEVRRGPSQASPGPAPSPMRVLLAWSVHALTASGAVLGTVALLDIAAGRLARAAALMLVAMFIDSVDGSLARAVGVARVVPRIDGRRLDDIVDYFNYAVVPAAFLLGLGALEHWAWAALPVLASAYGFAQREAKTSDDFFLGWPSYWNVVVIYLWLLDVGAVASAAVILLFSLLVFVPLRYVYPSRVRVLWLPTNLGAFAWMLAIGVAVLAREPAQRWHVAELSLAFPIYYVGLSAWLGRWPKLGE